MSHARGGQADVRQVARTTHSYRMGHGGAEVTDRAGSIPQYAKDIEGGSRRPHSAPLATTSPGGAGVLRRLLRPLCPLFVKAGAGEQPGHTVPDSAKLKVTKAVSDGTKVPCFRRAAIPHVRLMRVGMLFYQRYPVLHYNRF